LFPVKTLFVFKLSGSYDPTPLVLVNILAVVQYATK